MSATANCTRRSLAMPRVTSHERLNAKALKQAHLPAPPQLIVCDLSFVSLAKVLDTPLAMAAPQATLIALFKPQFEVGPENVGKGGLVTSDEATEAALGGFLKYLMSKAGLSRRRSPAPFPAAMATGNGWSARGAFSSRTDRPYTRPARAIRGCGHHSRP
jgi:hypothetical protein